MYDELREAARKLFLRNASVVCGLHIVYHDGTRLTVGFFHRDDYIRMTSTFPELVAYLKIHFHLKWEDVDPVIRARRDLDRLYKQRRHNQKSIRAAKKRLEQLQRDKIHKVTQPLSEWKAQRLRWGYTLGIRE
jgi:hypothetical protein